jgi:hypothetical protein
MRPNPVRESNGYGVMETRLWCLCVCVRVYVSVTRCSITWSKRPNTVCNSCVTVTAVLQSCVCVCVRV